MWLGCGPATQAGFKAVYDYGQYDSHCGRFSATRHMIGVIGPFDSVELALAVARDEGLGPSVVARAYGSVDEAAALALELDEICQVLLFTGRVPYVLGRRPDTLRAITQFVPHSGADLYRTLVQLLREFKGELPRISLDTIEPHVAEEAYEDLGFDAPRYVLPLEVGDDESDVRSSDEILAFHIARYRAGDVDACVTCVGSVYRELSRAGVPAWRIAHTRSVIREALRQAHLAARLATTEATQPAVVLVSVPGLRARSAKQGDPYETQRQRLKIREAILDYAEHLRGRLAELDDETFVVYTSRGTIEEGISRLMAGHGGPLQLPSVSAETRIGVGLGATVPGAEDNARRALTLAAQHGDLHVAFADGEVLRVDRDRQPATYRLRETHEPTLRLAKALGLGPLALSRLTHALRQVDPSAVTAAELAEAYGIEARSARRLLTSLQRAGIATRLGRQGGPRAGRPQTVFRVDVEQLAPSSKD